MISRVQLRNKAIELRREGKSYKEITESLGVVKGTLSGWLRDLPLTDQQNTDLYIRLQDKVARSRLLASITNRAKRMEREKVVYTEAEKEFKAHISDPFFAIGITLYWAEGSKKNTYFSFINSDPNMIDLMLKWMKRYLTDHQRLIKYRLYIHLPYKNENCEYYWAGVLGISPQELQKTIYKPTPHTEKKNPEYKGCIRISITRMDVLRKMLAWQKLLIQYYGNILCKHK